MKKTKILLGEDNNLASMELMQLFQGKINQLDVAQNTPELLQKYWGVYYDFILLNTWFQDSLQVTRLIREQEAAFKGKITPIIGIFSEPAEDAPGRSAEYQKYYDAGMNELFTPPLTQENIDKMLEKYSS